MATLEDLLAEDGFKRGRRKKKQSPIPGTSVSSDSRSSNSGVRLSGPKIIPVRTNSDVNPRRSVAVIPEKGGFTDPRPRKAVGRSYEKQLPVALESNVFTSLKESKECEGSSGKKHLDSNFECRRFLGSKDDGSEEKSGKWGYDRCYENGLFQHEEGNSSESQNLRVSPKVGCSVPVMNEAALKAITSVVNGCVDRLLKDESFRSSIHQVCVSSLNSSEVENEHAKNSDVLYTLKEAIEAVERMITEGPSQLELRKTSLKLSVITGLKSMDLDGGYTCGIPNSHLAGCAHLYLSILYKIQKKDKVSAKHLLQVFCDSPHQARTKLLPGLWKHLFLPHISHLKAWYDKELKSIEGTSDMIMKLELLDKAYDDFLDVGTSHFAAYYKGWLMDETGTPPIPSILIPFASFPEIAEDSNESISVESFSSNSSILSKTMISKRLYESILGQASRTETSYVMDTGDEEEVVENETDEGQSNVWGGYDDSRQMDEETECHSPNSGKYAAESFQEEGSQHSVASFEKNDQKKEKSYGSRSSSIIGMEEMSIKNEMVQSCHTIKGYDYVGKCYQQENDDPNLKKLSQATFQLQVINDPSNTYNHEQSIDFPVHDSYHDELTDVMRTKSVIGEAETTLRPSSPCSMQENHCVALFGSHEDTDGSLFAGFPKDFICPLTGLLLKEPVTLESGYTFELAYIKKRFDQGNKTCPVTGQSLKYSTLPKTNIVLKLKINEWVTECFKNSPSNTVKQVCNSKYELALSIFEQLLVGFSSEDKKENIKHLISLGGLDFLTQMFEFGSLEEKSLAAELIVQCIQADGCHRNYLVMNIRKSSLLELIHSGQIHVRNNAASLLIELIRLNRRMDITSFLSGLKTEASDTLMSDLLLCLKSSLPEERVLVAVLLLHLDLMEESDVQSVFRGEAVKCIIATLECCLSNKKFISNCRTALLMLGGHFSFSGEILTEIWLLNQAGFVSSSYNDEDDVTLISEEEVKKRQMWLKSMASIFLSYKRKSFVETLSKSWKMGSPDVGRVCLVTAAWLTHSLPSLSTIPSLQLSAASLALLPRLRESLSTRDVDIKDRILASLCLLNFSKISECRATLKEVLEEIHDPLKSLAEVTWTARHLCNYFFKETS